MEREGWRGAELSAKLSAAIADGGSEEQNAALLANLGIETGELALLAETGSSNQADVTCEPCPSSGGKKIRPPCPSSGGKEEMRDEQEGDRKKGDGTANGEEGREEAFPQGAFRERKEKREPRCTPREPPITADYIVEGAFEREGVLSGSWRWLRAGRGQVRLTGEAAPRK